MIKCKFKQLTFSVNVKWGKELFSDVEVDTKDEALTFKAMLYGLTNIPVDKQKIMLKGKMLKDSDDMASMGFKDGMTLMLMGTAEEKGLKEPEKPIVFLEDMTDEQRAKALNLSKAVVISAGLENLGNTCYMNAVM